MSRPHYVAINAQIAGATAAFFLLVGRWNPERLLGIESSRNFELNSSMLLEPRQWVLPILMLTALILRFPRKRSITKQQLVASRFTKLAFGCLVLLYMYMMISATWAPVPSLGILKAYEAFLVLGVLIVIGLWHLSVDAELFHRAFWKSLVVLTGALMVCALISLSNGRLAVLGGGPNIFARLMFLLAVGSMGIPQGRSPFQVILAVVAIALVVLSGSRGGMLAAAGGGLVYLWAERTKISSKFLLVSGGMTVGVLLLFFTPLGNRVYEAFSYRIIELTLQDGYTSGRDILVEEAIGIWKEYPLFGAGISGWTALMLETNETVFSHPHNIFCELLCEGGLVAVSLLTLTIGYFVRHALLFRNRLHVPSLACAAMFLTASLFSGDFFDSRGIFICAMLSSFPCSVKTRSIASKAKRPLNRMRARNAPPHLRRPRPANTEGIPIASYHQSKPL